MTADTTFDAISDNLGQLLKEVGSGQVQLPDFQRGWVWDDHHICNLVTSIARSFPIGAIMTLHTGGTVNFAPRYFEGVELPTDASGRPSKTAARLVLDGQQRLTALYQALLHQGAVKTKNDKTKTVERFYYVDIVKAFGDPSQRDEAVFSVPQDKRITRSFGKEVILDLQTAEREYEALAFPLNRTYACLPWFADCGRFWGYAEEKMKLLHAFQASFIETFIVYSVPVIQLKRTASKEAVCRVFEKVNSSGVSLTAFELVTATYAADDFNLREDWLGSKVKATQASKGRHTRLTETGRVLKGIESTDFLQCVSLLYTHWGRTETEAGRGGKNIPTAISCTRETILEIPLSAYQAHADGAEAGFKRARQFLWGEKIYSDRDLPYRTQLIPLAAILFTLGYKWHMGPVKERVRRWYWSGVFGELYGGAIESRFARDLLQVPVWATGGEKLPQTVEDCNLTIDRLRTLRSRLSAAYKGLYALLMQKDRAKDWQSGAGIEEQTYFEEKVDIHHIFPEAWCKKQGLPPAIYDSIVNKTALTASTNKFLGGQAPSLYLKKLEKSGWTTQQVDQLVTSHLIDVQALRDDDFFGMMIRRAEMLVSEIQAATGRMVGGRSAQEVFGELRIDDKAEEVG